MARCDGTGPLGQGPMTGRGMGFCVLRVPGGNTPTLGIDVGARGEQDAGASRETRKKVMTMPAGNGTGPLGFGPMTGRAAGYCAGYPVPGYMNPVPGRGFLNSPVAPAYGPAPYGTPLAPYGYGAGYARVWGGPFGRFGRGLAFCAL